MKTHLFGRQNLRGSALLAAMIVITILSFAAAGILSYSLTTYRNSVRQAALDQAKELSDGEMENLYFEWKSELLGKTPYANIELTLPIGPSSNAASLQGNNFPFLSSTAAAWGLTNYVSSDWSVTRYLHWNQVPNTSDGSATGIMPGTVNEIGKNFYYTAKTSATLTSPLFGTITYHSGRHFVYSSTSLFQFAVFYEGNLELAPGSDMLIQGPVATNASAYLGTVSGVTLTLASSVYYFQDYEGASDPLSGETDAITSTGLNDPIYNPNPLSAPPNQATQRANQVQKLSSQASFIGDVNVGADVLNPSYAQAYTNPNTGQVDPNEIYRAVIAPPPVVSGTTTLLTEDPLVAASRMYNAAGLLITINQANSAATPTVDIGGKQSDGTINTTAYDTDFAANKDNGTATSIIGAPIPYSANPTQALKRYPIVDPREALNGVSAVNISTLDIGNLTTAVTAAMATDPNLAANYNGVVYVYDNTNNATVSPGTLNGILLKNATTTPNLPDSQGNPLGFTVVTNNGLYVQGDYNTTTITVGGQQVPNPSGIMGDAVTALSYGYDPTLNHYNTAAPNNGLQAWASRNATTSPGDGPVTGTPYGMTIDAAILTGNTPTNTSVSPVIKSGGAQNLVRLIENWYSSGQDLQLSITGSLGQLFSSDFFQGAWPGTGAYAALGNNPAYLQPHQRNFSYDLHFQQRTPAGSPTTTSFHKGNFFFW
jgi:type II secretory pathway pseudopilin PulG